MEEDGEGGGGIWKILFLFLFGSTGDGEERGSVCLSVSLSAFLPVCLSVCLYFVLAAFIDVIMFACMLGYLLPCWLVWFVIFVKVFQGLVLCLPFCVSMV